MYFLEKDSKELLRNKIFLASIGLILVMSYLVLRQFSGLKINIHFSSLLVPLFEMSLYIIPFIAMTIAAFSILQEKSQKTLPILLTSYYSPWKFLLDKTISANIIMSSILFCAYLLLFFFGSFMMKIDFSQFLIFMVAVLALSFIFTQIGIFLGSTIRTKLQALIAILLTWLFFLMLFDLILMNILPFIRFDNVFGFSILYFLSPINALHYFILVKLHLYDLSSFSAIFDHVTFHQPTLVMLVNIIGWSVILFIFSGIMIKSQGANS